MILRAGLATGASDFVWACVLSVLVYGSTFVRLWQGVASVPLGTTALEGGTPMVLAGIVLHFLVAFSWSALFVAMLTVSPVLRGALEQPASTLAVAGLFGPFIWVTMSMIIVPAFTHRVIPINTRWWIQLAGHFLFVGLPMALAVRTLLPRATSH